MSASRQQREWLRQLETSFNEMAQHSAAFLVYDRPERVLERPGIARAYFSQRCVSDRQLSQTVEALRAVQAYVETFAGEQPFIEALASGHIQGINRDLKIVYNGIEGGIAQDGFEPGRKALIPALADSYELLCSNSNAYGCAVGRHKYHYFTLLRSAGLATPMVWHYSLQDRWAADKAPPKAIRVIVKSTFESWSVGVRESSKFTVGSDVEERVRAIAQEIGQPVCVQEFIPGAEVCVPVFSLPLKVSTTPVRVILSKAPDDPEAIMTIDDNIKSSMVLYEPLEDPEGGLSQEMQSLAVSTFKYLQLQAFARVDFRVDAEGQPWIIDVGVSPGLSTGSSAFASLASLGFSHDEFLRIVFAATLSTKGKLPNFHARIQRQAF